MNERQWTNMDKSGWGDGPWQSEPDKMQWTDAATGMACLAVRAPVTGSWCGYAAVERGHPLYGLSGDEASHAHETLYAHGGLTFARSCQESADPARGVCHIPEPGKPDDVWWFGFDYAHAGDLTPGMNARMRDLMPSGLPDRGIGDRYTPLDEVREEVADLAKQLAEIV